MNFYKKILRSQDLRKKVFHLFDFVPDKMMVKIQYKLKTGNKLNLKNPQRYTEKLQWYKLFYRNPLLTKCSDKYHVREYVEEKGLGFLLNDLYGYYTKAEDIDFDALPNEFVIKSTTGSGNNIIVKDKSELDIEETKKRLSKWLELGDETDGKSIGREWCYDNVKPALIVEKFLGRDKNGDLPDYKFFCFDGRVYCLYVMVNYTDNHETGQIGFYDENFNKLPFCRVDYRDIDFDIEKPKNFEKMVEYAKILSKDFPHVRVDFYDLDGDITFGELTFYNASGYTKFNPDSADYEMGKQFILPKDDSYTKEY